MKRPSTNGTFLHRDVFDDNRAGVVDYCAQLVGNGSVNGEDGVNLVCVKQVDSKFHMWSIYFDESI
ncbi:hypothetical protein [Neolewinella agarilytica]|uniref:hypothetical protein n=1 Tax=Neolewinella agarilytica TaxID=478744 RepID=UPI001113F919|nr:hypothetical protein [Neolewinella agarilytica]